MIFDLRARYAGQTLEYLQDRPSPMARDVDLRVPNDGFRYVQILHDHQYPPLGEPRQRKRNIKYAIPAIVEGVRLMAPNTDAIPLPYRGKVYDYVRLSAAWQYFLFHLWSWSVWDAIPIGRHEGFYRLPMNPDLIFDKYTDGSLLWYYANMIMDSRSHTDANSPETGSRDYVTDRNPNGLPYSWLCKSTTGNLLRVLNDAGVYWRVEALDLAKPPPALKDLQGKDYLIHWATEQTVIQLPDKTWVVSRYPQAKTVARLNGLPDTGTPIPNVSLGGSYLIQKAHCKLLAAGQVWTPYNPGK